MLKKILKIFKREYQTLNRIDVIRDNLIYNYKYLSSLDKKVKIAPVVKSNGYGHGMKLVGKTLDLLNPPFFCVDSLYEAYELLKAGIKTQVLIMGYTDPKNFKVKKLPFSYAVFNTEILKILDKYQPSCEVHIFVDTGMNREGIQIEDLPDFLIKIKQLPNIKVAGLMSHLASADDSKNPLNNLQIKNFKKAQEILKRERIKPKWIHLQNSDGLALHLSGVNVNMARAGLSLYGVSYDHKLKPVLTLKSKIVQIKKIEKGEKVGYEGTYLAKKDMIIGILPLGYYDGVDRGLSNKGVVKIAGVECPIIGRVSMNITTVDLTNLKNPKVGQEVLVYSDNPNDKNSIENVAKICKKIPYEILVNLAESTRRVVI